MQGARLPDGSYLATYPGWYSADEITDKDGDTAVKADIAMHAVKFNYLYYWGDYGISVIVPVGKIEVNGTESSGVGDIELGAGWFLPVKSVDLLAALFVDLPTGPYDKADRVNFGTGQWDIGPTLYLSKRINKFQIDAITRYNFHIENGESGWKPGNEFYAEATVNYAITPRLWAGPSVIYVKGADGELDGVRFDNTATTSLSLGGEVFYALTRKTVLLLSVMEEVEVENGSKGRLILGRISYFF